MTPDDRARLIRLYGSHRSEHLKRAVLWLGLLLALLLAFLACLVSIHNNRHFLAPAIITFSGAAWVCSRAVDAISAVRELSDDIKRERGRL